MKVAVIALVLLCLTGCMNIYKCRVDTVIEAQPPGTGPVNFTVNLTDTGGQDATLSKSVTPTTTATIPLK